VGGVRSPIYQGGSGPREAPMCTPKGSTCEGEHTSSPESTDGAERGAEVCGLGHGTDFGGNRFFGGVKPG